jgi:hypothetical protein
MLVSRHTDTHTGADAANDPTLMAVCGVGARHPRPFPIDKFTKWSKAATIVKINKQYAVKFIKLIACKFGVPNRIITDNGYEKPSGQYLGLICDE